MNRIGLRHIFIGNWTGQRFKTSMGFGVDGLA